MRERDLQHYLFENPDVLFPGQVIGTKRREVYIEGRRIDLLFDVEGVQYIVELKRDTIKRETIGQIFEYYALMRMSRETANFKMILVAPSIPVYRRLPLEEFGIRCVELEYQPATEQEASELRQRVVETRKRERANFSDTTSFAIPNSIRFDDLAPPINASSLQLSQFLLRDGLLIVERNFPEYEVLPVKISNSRHPDILCFPCDGTNPADQFVRIGAWWAYAFGQAEEMPKNDVPNISVNALPWGLDFAVNAELRTSQAVMKYEIAASSRRFDQLITEHGSLELQTWLKVEHQPRFYHWIPLERKPQGSWKGQDLLDLCEQAEGNYANLRSQWVDWIQVHRPELSANQLSHMKKSNRNLNLALRLVHSFGEHDDIWSHPYEEQRQRFSTEYLRMKPLIDFFSIGSR